MNLFYAVRTKKDLAFHGLFEFYSQRHSQFQYHPILSHDSDWSGDKGYLSVEFIANKVGELKDKLYFICGPDPMSEAILNGLEKASVPDENIHTERFISPANLDESDISEQQAQIKWMDKELRYDGRESLLEFLESQGESLAYACRTGVCGSCKCKINGPFKMLTDAGLTRSEKKEGYALACVSYPEGDLEIKLS